MAVSVLLSAGCGGKAGVGAIDVAPSAAPVPGGESTEASPSGVAGTRFGTLPPGSALPDDAACASRVRPVEHETRQSNVEFNRTRGHPTPAGADPAHPRYARVTGDFVGKTDEIIQWVACKWGIDEDVVRAQAAKETYWFQKNAGDFTIDPTLCVPGHPIGRDGREGECPESIGIMQVRYPFFKTTITDAVVSTAYNLDLAYSVWRTCFEGEEQWLNDVEPGQPYAAGDLWGCVGRWFAGRWYNQPAKDYIAAVQDYVNGRIWETRGFLDFEE